MNVEGQRAGRADAGSAGSDHAATLPDGIGPEQLDRWRDQVRTVADWPEPGVQFRDLMPALADPATLAEMVTALAAEAFRRGAGAVVGIDARGFILGTGMALEIGIGFVPVRKAGKLPGATIGEDYDLEYGSDRLEIQTDVLAPGSSVVLVDDLIATGGTMLAAARLLERLDIDIVAAMAAIDLPDLGGSTALADAGLDVFALLSYPDA